MFSVYKTVHPPTGIDNSVYCYFINQGEPNLITSSANRLSIYRLNEDPSSSNNAKLKLECVETFTLHGQICAIKPCRYGNMTKDALIIAFANAKLSIVQFDSFTGDLITLSIHYFEDELEKEGIHYNIYPPILRVDPNMKCAVMLIFGFKLVVIPFHEEHQSSTNMQTDINMATANTDQQHQQQSSNQDSTMNIDLNESTSAKFHPFQHQHQPAPSTTNTSSLSSYTIDLRKLDNWLEMRIIDIEFLYGYYEPTLFILCESTMTWIGRYSVKKDTCNSVALSLNLAQRIHPLIWPVDKLPSDCLRCHAVPQPIGGMLIFAVNSLIYINQSVPAYAVALNSMARATSAYPFKSMEHIKCALDMSTATFVEPSRLIMSLKGGELYIVSLLTDSESLRTVRTIHIEKGPSSVIASCLTKCGASPYLFICSRLGNSVLLKYTTATTSSIVAINDVQEEEMPEQMGEQEEILKEDKVTQEYDELDQLLELNEEEKSAQNGRLAAENSVQVTHVFDVCDILLNIAPCGHSVVGESVGDYTEFVNSAGPNIDLVTSSGQTKNGAISILQRSLRPECIATFQIPDVLDMWSVNSTSELTYLFLSKVDSTVILQMGGEISELEKDSTAFCTKQPTLLCANLTEIGNYILQVTTSSFYLFTVVTKTSEQGDEEEASTVSGPELVMSYDFVDKLDSRVKWSQLVAPFIGLLTENGTLLVYAFEESRDGARFELVLAESGHCTGLSCFSFYKDEPKGLFSNEWRRRRRQLAAKVNEMASGEDDLVVPNNTSHDEQQLQQQQSDNAKKVFTINSTEMSADINVEEDDDDEMLYSSNEAAVPAAAVVVSKLTATKELKKASNSDSEETSSIQILTEQKKRIIEEEEEEENEDATYWLFSVCSQEGTLRIYNLQKQANVAEDISDEPMQQQACRRMQLVYSCNKFINASKTLVPEDNYSASSKSRPKVAADTAPSSLPTPPLPPVAVRLSSLLETGNASNSNGVVATELLVVNMTPTRPLLVAKCDEDLLVYEAYLATADHEAAASSSSARRRRQQINLKRVNHEMILREKRLNSAGSKRRQQQQHQQQKSEAAEANGDLIPSAAADMLGARLKTTPTLRSFSNVAGYSGFVILNPAGLGGGSSCFFAFFCARSGLTAHPLWLDGALSSFAPLQNSQITMSGFVYMTRAACDIRICTLPTADEAGKLAVHYDAAWVLRKVQLRQTVHFLVYHEESKCYAVVTSVAEPTNRVIQSNEEAALLKENKDNPNSMVDPSSQQSEASSTQNPEAGGSAAEHEKVTLTGEQRDENFILPTKSQFSIQLYAPASEWEPLPLGKFVLNECEHVTCLKLVSLPYEGHSSGFRDFLAAGTIFCFSEDVNTRGRLLIFDVIETVPEPGKPLTAIKMKTIFDKEQKGPVTSVESVDGHLIGCVGQKVFIWEYANDELIGKAFIDTNFYVHRMVALKHFVLIADLHHSVALVRFQPEYKKLSYVAKDKQKIDVYACEYLVDNSNLSFLSTDSEKNLTVHMYQSNSHDNQGGCWLVRKAEFNVGSHINSMFRLKCRVNDPNSDKRSALADKRHVTYCTNLDGGIGYVIPVTEKMFRRLFILQNAIYIMKPHYAGLNPKSYRAWRSRRRELTAPQRNILDGDLLFEYFNLSYGERSEIAKKIKTSSEQLLDDLTEIFQFTCHF